MTAIFFWLVLATLIMGPTTSRATSNPSKICQMILRNAKLGQAGILVSPEGVSVANNSLFLSLNNPDIERNHRFIAVLSHVPFAQEIMREIPAFTALTWEASQHWVFATFSSRNRNLITVFLDTRGLIEIHLGASDDRERDDLLFQEAIELLRKNKAEALLFTQSYLVPRHPEDGVELWFTRLDGNSRPARAATQDILVYLSAGRVSQTDTERDSL